jgi:hypothetical protein
VPEEVPVLELGLDPELEAVEPEAVVELPELLTLVPEPFELGEVLEFAVPPATFPVLDPLVEPPVAVLLAPPVAVTVPVEAPDPVVATGAPAPRSAALKVPVEVLADAPTE